MQRYSDRVCSPEATLERVTPWLEMLGVTRLSRLTGLDRVGIPVWNAVSPNSRGIVINQGKGIRDIDARVSAAMEAIEFAIAAAPPVGTRLEAASVLRAEGCDVETLDALVALGQADVSDTEMIEWMAGTNLLSDRPAWVPAQAISLDRTDLVARFWQISDGLASGNVAEEAILHGLLERIERDAEVLWKVSSSARKQKSCIDPALLEDDVVNGLCERINAAGLRLRLFDITSDTGIPAFMALLGPEQIIDSRSTLMVEVTQGAGTHPSTVRAAIRAITEAAQSRLTYISGARDDIAPETFRKPLSPDVRQLFDAEPGPLSNRPAQADDDLDALIEFVLRALGSIRMSSAIAVPLTTAEHPFAVVKVVVPGLENPDGLRKRRLGARAIARALRGA